MPLESHYAIQEPDEDAVIWRYYSTSQFLWSLQEQALYLSRLDQFEDPFEGYSPVKNLKKEIDSKTDQYEWLEEFSDDIELGDAEERTKQSHEFIRRSSLVNCWSKGEEDSLSMWKSYLPSGDGIVVRSSFESLVDAIDRKSDVYYHVGKVHYFDYFDEFKRTSNIFEFIMSKPRQYQYENEIRVFVWWPSSGEVEIPEGDPGDNVTDDKVIAPTGTKLEVDLNTLIDRIYVSPFGPKWLTVDYWNDILDKYGIDATAERSDLAMEPDDILSRR